METLKRLPVLETRWPVLLNNLFNRDAFNEGNLNFFDQNSLTGPAANIKETDSGFTVEMLAPGMSKSDFKVELDQNQLIISAEHKTGNETDSGTYHRREFRFQAFKRSFTLPENVVDMDKISAQYNEGILYVSIPKKEEALPKPVKLIEIS